MSETQTYKIAGHKVVVELTDAPAAAAKVAPSFQPFLVDAQSDGNVILSVVVDSKYRPDASELKKIAHFSITDSEYSMFERADRSVVFTIRDYDRTPMTIIDISPDFASAKIVVMPKDSRYVRVLANAIMIAYTFATSGLNTLTIHSSTVRYQGRAYMFLGKSGTGKSTHSQAWLRNFPDVELMNDDNPIVRLDDNGATAYGSPWSGKTPCYKQTNAPIGAFVGLVQAKHNKIEKLDCVKGFVHLFSSVSTLICHSKAYDSILNTTLRLAERVPVYEFENLPDDDAAQLCNSTVVCR